MMSLIVLVAMCLSTLTAVTQISCPSDDRRTCCGQAGYHGPSTLSSWLTPASTSPARRTVFAATVAERRSPGGTTVMCRWTFIDGGVPPALLSLPWTADDECRPPSTCRPTSTLTVPMDRVHQRKTLSTLRRDELVLVHTTPQSQRPTYRDQVTLQAINGTRHHGSQSAKSTASEKQL